ncbi:MAG: FtsQ-type POTRA domain-containing protein [Clostridiales bacterium]|jgi:cell division protein FtsQ|nr:FtsQ-type POTRA domain-containing protein [Clostridiales bacterium]
MKDYETLSPREKRKHRIKERRKKRAKRIFFTIGCLAIGLLGLMVFVQSPVFSIEKIEVTGAVRLSKDEITAAGLIEGANYFSVSASKAEKMLEKNPFVFSAEIIKKLPDSVTVNIKERKPRVYIKYGDSFVLVDETGYILGVETYASDSSLPVATGMSFSEASAGKQIETEDTNIFVTIIDISRALSEYNIPNAWSIDVSDINNITAKIGLWDVYIGSNENINEKIALFAGAIRSDKVVNEQLLEYEGSFDISSTKSQYFKMYKYSV